MKYKAIIFDMDGTIVDTENIWKKATIALLERYDVVYTPKLEGELFSKVHGLALHKSCQIIKDVASLPGDVKDLARETAIIANELYERDIQFIQGFENFHQEITHLGLPHAVATNADDSTIAVTNRKLALTTFFGEHIYGISHVNFVCKPDPAIYLHAAGQLRINPEQCIAIEDSAHGVAAAKNAGMFCIGINTANNIDLLRESNHIVQAYSEIDLMKLLKKKS